jgi:hypothetical protein
MRYYLLLLLSLGACSVETEAGSNKLDPAAQASIEAVSRADQAFLDHYFKEGRAAGLSEEQLGRSYEIWAGIEAQRCQFDPILC